MATITTRRTLLRLGSAVGLGALAGCSGLSGVGDDGTAATGGEGGWTNWRGPPTNAGRLASSGPAAAATHRRTITAGDDVELLTTQGPLVGSSGEELYGVEVARTDQGVELRGVSLARDGSQRWSQTIRQLEGPGAIRGVWYSLGPERLFVHSYERPASGEPPRFVVAAADRDGGNTDWVERFEPSLRNEPLPIAYAEGAIYLFHGGRVLSLAAEDGSARWRTPEITPLQLLPTVADGSVVVYNRGGASTEGPRLTAFDAGDGTEQWSVPMALEDSIRPVVSAARGSVYLVEHGPRMTGPRGNVTDREIVARSLADGTERWRHRYDTPAVRASVTPGGTWSVTAAGDHVYYALGFAGDAYFERLRRTSALSDAEIARLQEEETYDGPNLVALDRTDGSVTWRSTLGDRGRVYAPLAADGQHLYALRTANGYVDDTAEVYVIDRGDGDVLGSFGPVPHRQRPLALGNDTAYVLTADGVQLWS